MTDTVFAAETLIIINDGHIQVSLNVLKDTWTITKRSAHSGDLVMLYELLLPDELELAPNLTHHMLALQLTYGDRTSAHFD